MNLTPYDTGERLEPLQWTIDAKPSSPEEIDRYGRVDFDDEEGSTVLTAFVERKLDGIHALHVEVHDEAAIDVKVTVDDVDVLLLKPSPGLQEKVLTVIADLPTEQERKECLIFWQPRQALILVGGETGVRHQQAIIVHDDDQLVAETMSATVGAWSNGVDDMQIS